MHTLILPGFTIVTMLLIHAVGSSTGVIVLSWSSLCFKRFFIATGWYMLYKWYGFINFYVIFCANTA